MRNDGRRGLRPGALALVGALLAAGWVAGGPHDAASAHDELLASTPASGEELATAPDVVTLQFSDEVLTIGAVVVVVDEDETSWVSGEARLEGTTVAADLAPDMPAGQYEARWRVVSSDGHPIAGVVPFAIGEPVDAGRTDAGGTDDAATDAGGTDDADGSSADTTDPAPAAANADGTASILRTVGIGLAGAIVAGGLFLAIGARAKRRRPTTAPDTGTTTDRGTPSV